MIAARRANDAGGGASSVETPVLSALDGAALALRRLLLQPARIQAGLPPLAASQVAVLRCDARASPTTR
jgi:hypothetical protein